MIRSHIAPVVEVLIASPRLGQWQFAYVSKLALRNKSLDKTMQLPA